MSAVSEFSNLKLETIALQDNVLHFTVRAVFAVTQLFSLLVLSMGVTHERHSSSFTAGAKAGRSGGPDPSADMN